jgi:hypothetical protein
MMKHIFADPVALFIILLVVTTALGVAYVFLTLVGAVEAGIHVVALQSLFAIFIAPFIEALAIVSVVVILARIFKLHIRRFVLDVEMGERTDPGIEAAQDHEARIAVTKSRER